MIGAIIRGALWLDTWLQERLGRPYNLVLGVGLIGEIIHRLSEAPKAVTSVHGLIGSVLVLLMELALLIHQVGSLSHHFKGPRGRRGRGGDELHEPAPEHP